MKRSSLNTSLFTHSILLLFTLVITASCGDDEVKSPKDIHKLIINDTLQNHSNVLARLDEEKGEFRAVFEGVNGIGISILYLLPSGNQITLSFANDNSNTDCIHPGKYQTHTEDARKETPYGYGAVIYSDHLNKKSYKSNNFSNNQVITITSCDAKSKTVSGSFSLTLANVLDDEDELQVSGNFNNLAYTDNLP